MPVNWPVVIVKELMVQLIKRGNIFLLVEKGFVCIHVLKQYIFFKF